MNSKKLCALACNPLLSHFQSIYQPKIMDQHDTSKFAEVISKHLLTQRSWISMIPRNLLKSFFKAFTNPKIMYQQDTSSKKPLVVEQSTKTICFCLIFLLTESRSHGHKYGHSFRLNASLRSPQTIRFQLTLTLTECSTLWRKKAIISFK